VKNIYKTGKNKADGESIEKTRKGSIYNKEATKEIKNKN